MIAALLKLVRRVLGMTEQPEFVEFPQATLDPPRHVVTIEITPDDCLSREELRQLNRFGSGVQTWWIRWQGQSFASLDPDLPPGDTPFSRKLLLPHGLFTLGVGREPYWRRIDFSISSDGSLARLPSRTDAHATAS